MIRERVENFLQSRWIAFSPGLALISSMLAFSMAGDSLRDIFDPRVIPGSKGRVENS